MSALGAEGLQRSRPSVDVVHQHPGHQMMRRVAMQFHSNLSAHDRIAAVRADYQPRLELVAPAFVLEMNFRRIAGDHAHVTDFAQQRRAGTGRGRVQQIAHIRMPHA